MRSNRRRHANVLPIASLATWIIVAAFACCAGLYYVYCKHQLLERGNQIHGLERELAELKNLNECAKTRIDMLSSPAALRQRRTQDLAKYVEITQDKLVLLTEKPADGSELRTVANIKQ